MLHGWASACALVQVMSFYQFAHNLNPLSLCGHTVHVPIVCNALLDSVDVLCVVPSKELWWVVLVVCVCIAFVWSSQRTFGHSTVEPSGF